MNNIQISPSILSCDFGHLAEEIKKAHHAGVDSFHLDIMDGHFVPNISFGPTMVAVVRGLTSLPLDAHLMIDNPWFYIEDFVRAGSDIITLHVESYDASPNDVSQIKTRPRFATKIKAADLRRDINLVKSFGKKIGLALNPGTPASVVKEFLAEINLVLVMSVNPGFSGQKFMPEVLPKIYQLRQNFKGDINVDGGINAETAPQVIAAGANVLVSASYFFQSNDYAATAKSLRG
ncbi:MAG: ribulose-phosphate 3-epimerase [Candidatus Margulisiibacteriota bacterium]